MKRFCLLVAAIFLGSLPTNFSATAEEKSFTNELAAVRQRVAEMRLQLGAKAGEPEVADKFQPIPKNARWLTPDEAKLGFQKLAAEVARRRWWQVGLDPTKLDHALREPASVISGCVHLERAGLADHDTSLKLARDAADFLIWAQTQAGAGVFPFPAFRGRAGDNAFVAAGRFLDRAEQAGKLAEVVRNGWVFADEGDGGLQFDNGEAGVALFELYEISRDTNHLAAARKSADWAISRPLAPNWNYNSFSVALLAKAFAATGERKYLGAATRKARLGVIPGQLTDGPRAGRWLDPHNARPSYHYIMLRGLAALAAVMPKDDPARPEIVQALKLGLHARNPDFLGAGAPNKDHAMETLVFVNRHFATDPVFLRDTQSAEALDALGRLVSDEARQGRLPLGPRAWGIFLAYVAAQAAK